MSIKECSVSDESKSVELKSTFVRVYKISRSYLRSVSLCYNKTQVADSTIANCDERYFDMFFFTFRSGCGGSLAVVNNWLQFVMHWYEMGPHSYRTVPFKCFKFIPIR